MTLNDAKNGIGRAVKMMSWYYTRFIQDYEYIKNWDINNCCGSINSINGNDWIEVKYSLDFLQVSLFNSSGGVFCANEIEFCEVNKNEIAQLIERLEL